MQVGGLYTFSWGCGPYSTCRFYHVFLNHYGEVSLRNSEIEVLGTCRRRDFNRRPLIGEAAVLPVGCYRSLNFDYELVLPVLVVCYKVSNMSSRSFLNTV